MDANREEAVLTGEDEGGGSAEEAKERSSLISAERRHLLGSQKNWEERDLDFLAATHSDILFLDLQMSGRGRPCLYISWKHVPLFGPHISPFQFLLFLDKPIFEVTIQQHIGIKLN